VSNRTLKELVMNKFIVVSLMALAFVNPNPAKADMAVEAKLRLLGSKLVKIDTAIATGSCASCAGSLAVLKADLAKLAALPNLLQGERDALTEIDRKADALDQKLDQLPSLTAKEVVNQLTAKYGAPYFQNFINSDLSPEDVRSMCCRLQMDLRQLRNKVGGLFGAGDLTGSIGVVTLNLPRIGYLAENEEDFFGSISV